jgi:hypothetical protein
VPYRYVPHLRSKAGEAVALENLSAPAKARMLPIIHVSEAPPPTFAHRAGPAWAGLPMALDGMFNYGSTGSLQDFNTVFHALGAAAVGVIPATECNAPAQYVAGIMAVIGRYGAGLVVKATIGQLPVVDAWVAAQGWNQADIDLVIDAGHVGAYGNAAPFAAFVLHALRHNVPQVPGWRSVTLASAAAPRDYSAVPVGRSTVPRLDWQLWGQVSGQTPFALDYGDYGVSHPDLTEPPGVAMTVATVSVRYAIDDEWIINKGYRTTGPHGRPMAQQFHGHAVALTNEAQFGGIACWGDGRIQQIAAGGGIGSGSRATWVGLSVNRHLSLVANRLP